MKVRLNGKGNNMLEKIQNMQSSMETATKDLENRIYTSEAGGGMVTAEIKGSGELLNLNISPEIMQENDPEMLAEIIIAAVNGALKTANEDKDKVMQELSDGLNLPNIPGLF